MFVTEICPYIHSLKRSGFTDMRINPEAFVNGLLTPYLFVIYSILTQAGMALIGILLLRSCIANRVLIKCPVNDLSL